MNMKSNMDQIVGTIVGAASGDALGARHEFHPPLTDPSPLEMGSGGAFDWRKGQWTDDTEQSIVLLRQLVQGHDLLDPEVLDRVARGLVDWGMGATDIGMQTRAALTRITPSNATAANVMAAAQTYLDNNPDACGNGSLMRTAPVAIAYLDDEAKMIEAARTISRLTHPHADALDACAIWCVAIRIAILENRLDIREAITRAVDDPDRRALWFGRIEFAEAAEAVSDIPDNGGAVGALQAAWRAVSVAVSAEDAIEAAVRSGNDADTVGAIAGALAGARFGCSAIPARWRRYLNGWPYSSETLDLPMQYRQLLTFAYLAGTGGQSLTGSGWPDVEDMGGYDLALVELDNAERVWIGAEGDIHALPPEVDAVVSLSRVGSAFAGNREHVEFWLVDSSSPESNPNLRFVLKDAADTVAALVAEGRTVFLHCVAAHNRTPSVAALYLALHCGIDVDEAIRQADEQCGNNGSNSFLRNEVRAIARERA